MGFPKGINTPVRMQQMIRPLEWWLDNSEIGGANFILRDGELGIAKISGQPPIIKVGDGTHNWDQLPSEAALEQGKGEKSIQVAGIAEASGINAVALGGLRYDYFAYKYSWEFSVQLPNSKYSTHYGYYYKNTEGEYAAVSSADSTNISDQQIVEGGKYITTFGGGNTEYTTSLTSAVIAEDGTIVSAPIITFTDGTGTVYIAEMVESPYLGRVKTTAAGNQSFAAGGSVCAYGDWSVAFGKDTAAYQKASFAEGGGTIAGDPEGEDTYSFAHAEGESTKATGRSAHSEGNNTQATGAQAHAENYKTTASGQHSHAEGSETTATNKAAHAEGYKTTASGTYSHAEGNRAEATGSGAHAEGNTTHAIAEHAHAEGYNTTASGPNSHAEGYVTTASGESAHTEGLNTKATAQGSHAEGYLSEATGLYSHVEGQKGEAKANYSHVEGDDNTVEVDAASAHAEGMKNTVSGANAHAEGKANTVSGQNAHAEGASNTVSGECSHAEGNGNKVLGAQAHAEGGSNEVHGGYGHAEGNKNISKNWFSHVEGSENQALHSNSHVGGKGNISGQNSQTVVGEYNKVDADAYFIVGNGEKAKQDDGTYREIRRNAFVVSRTGNGNFAGKVISAGKELITGEEAERIAKEEIRKIVEVDNNGIVDKLNEIAEWIDNDQTGATKIVQDLSQAQTDIDQLQSQTATLNNSFGGLNTRVTANEGAINELERQVSMGYMPEVGDDGDVVAVVNGVWQSSAVISNLQAEVQTLRDQLATVLNVTAADAGKILRVNTEGKWELVELNSFEEEKH